MTTRSMYILSGLMLAIAASAHAEESPLLNEDFESPSLPAGWLVSNFSDNPVSLGWFKPQVTADTFAAQAGSEGSYVASNVFVGATDEAGNPFGRVDAMLLTPQLSLQEATVLTFWTRTVAGSQFGDALQVGAFVAGSYVPLLSINGSLSVGAYPEGWTQYSVTLPGQGTEVVGRFFFEYRIPDASTAGNFIGLDSVQVSVTSVPEPSTGLTLVAGLTAVAGLCVRRTRATA